MKLYLECGMGASGDMLMAALYELLPDKSAFLEKMNSLGLPGIKIECVPAKKCGISGTHINVYVNGEEETVEDTEPGEHINHEHDLHEHEHAHSHAHNGYKDICALIDTLDLPEKVRCDSAAVYRLLGEAEAEVHGAPIEHIHFHEVGTMDAVADIVGCCLLIGMLAPESISASPVHVGSGFVRCVHGVLPVPAPATALLLKGVPIYGGRIKGELCTPTGAAILKHFVERFGDMEPMTTHKIGYGMGFKDFEAANCVRAFWGEGIVEANEVAEICCNIDDMTPEAIGAVSGLFLSMGALDVYTVPIYMKKNRPAIMLCCLCRPGDRDKFSKLMLKHTTTFGVRSRVMNRDILEYSFYDVETPYGTVRVKSGKGSGIEKEKPEYEDVLSAAEKNHVPFLEVYKKTLAAIEKHREKN